MVDNGFYSIAMPDTHIAENIFSWRTVDEFYQTLSKRSRQHFREDVKKHIHKFDVTVIDSNATEEETDHWYQLYLNVKSHNLDLNTFVLPKKFFNNILQNKNWEVLSLTLKKEYAGEEYDGKPVCVVLCYKSGLAYTPMIIGINYDYNKAFRVYRQALYQIISRAGSLDVQKVFLGFSASVEKRKLGAKVRPVHAYVQSKDSFNAEVLLGLSRTNASALQPIL